MKDVRFGIGLAATDPPEEFIATVKQAEALGFDSIWVPDYRLYQDLYVSLALVALNTTRVRIGSAVTNPYTRHPGLTAVGIASVDRLSGGRAVLGLAPGYLILRLLGIERERPVQACREAILEIRRFFGSPAVGGGAGHVRLDLPVRPDLPIFVAATGHAMLALAGELADGVIINVGANEACLKIAKEAVARGMARAGRLPGSVEQICWLMGTAVSEDDPAAARSIGKRAVALSLGRSPKWMLDTMGIAEAPVREMYRVYHAAGAAAAAQLITDDMIDKFTISGSPQRAIERLASLNELGFDEFIFLSQEVGTDKRGAMRALAETVVQPLRRG